MKINLYFKTLPNSELLQKGIESEIIRLLGKVQFKAKVGWTESEIGIIDTGAPLSLIPLDMWQDLQVKILADSSIRGIVPKKQCVLPVKVGSITIRVIDEEHISKPLNILLNLAPHNKVPLIFGFQNLLSEVKVYFNYNYTVFKLDIT